MEVILFLFNTIAVNGVNRGRFSFDTDIFLNAALLT